MLSAHFDVYVVEQTREYAHCRAIFLTNDSWILESAVVWIFWKALRT